MTRTAAQRTPADSAPAGLRMGSWLMGLGAVGFIGFDTLCHLGPIYLATGIFVVGALVALPGIIAQSRS
jgi:hypothetical protein